MSSLPKYILNFDELESDLQNKFLEGLDAALENKNPNANRIIKLISDIQDKLPSNILNKLKKQISQLFFKYNGQQKINGKLLNIPAIEKEFKIIWKFDKKVFLTGFTIDMTGWKKEDSYDLFIGKNKIINNSITKEIGEHKYFYTYYKVDANNPISFVFKNKSGNSRQVLVDLEYLLGKKETIEPPTPPKPPKPTKPSIENIPNDWDIAVQLDWEANSSADIDLWGFIGNKYVNWMHKKEENFFLNFDFVQHMDDESPEIISVKGYRNKVLEIYVMNFNNVQCKEKATIKVYKKKRYGKVLIKKFNIDVNRGGLLSVCSIDLNKQTAKKLNKQRS